MGFSLGGFFSDIFGSTNKTKATAPTVDPNAYQYGGAPGGADAAAGRYANTGASAQYRQGAQAQYNQADQAYGQSQNARAGQASLASRMDARAAGAVPSIAGMQAQQDMQRAQAAQMAASASARGPAGIALAQQQAANNTANAQGQISGQAQVNAANERLQAEQNAMGAYGALRGGDQASQGQLAQQSQFNASLQQQQHAQNDTMQLGMTQAEQNVRNAQLTAGMNQQAQQSSNALGATGINAGVAGQNAAMNQQNGMLPIKLMQGGAGAAAMARGGSLPRGHRAIVGEEGPEYIAQDDRRGFMVGQDGPELIVPRQDSVVIPNDRLARVMKPGASTWGNVPEQAPARDYAYDPAFYDGRAQRMPMTGGMAVAGFSPGMHQTADEPLRRRDQDTIFAAKAKQAEGLELDDKETQAAKSARFRERQSQKNEANSEDAADEKAPPPKKPMLSNRMKPAAAHPVDLTSGVDVSYHGPMGGQQAVQLIPIGGARAMGGPVDSGVPYMVGEQGPEELVPMSGPGAPGSIAAAPTAPALPSFESQMANDPSSGMMSAKGAAMANHPDIAAANARIRNPRGAINAFEDGGEAKADKPAVVGERGPEAVLPLYEPPGKQLHQSAEGHAYYADEPSEDNGRPSLASRMKGSPAPAAAMSKPTPPPKAAPRKMTPDELMAAAKAMGEQQSAQHEARMANGPAVRVPVQLGQTPDGQQVAQVSPEEAIRFNAQRPLELPEGMPDSPTALSPPQSPLQSDAIRFNAQRPVELPEGMSPEDMPTGPHALPPPRQPAVPAAYGAPDASVQWPGTDYRVIPVDLPYTMNRRAPRGGGGLARAMRKR